VLLQVDAWDPAFGTGLETGEGGGGPAAQSSAQLDPNVELPASSWRPLLAPGTVRAPDLVHLVDGVRRVDARVWVTDDQGLTQAGLAASYAAGVVRCDLRRGVAEVAVTSVARGLFTPSRAGVGIGAGSIRYPFRRVRSDEPGDLVLGVQAGLRDLEVQVAGQARSTESEPATEEDLLIVDGPLQGRTHLPRALGYVKSHKVEYLSPELSKVVTALRAGERCPVFRLGTSWHRYAWYLRLPGPGTGSPWAGVIRAECSADLPVNAAIGLADLSCVTLPRFASNAYKDPRAPQNLVPIAGLERRLRAMLGDARLIHRSLTHASRSVPTG